MKIYRRVVQDKIAYRSVGYDPCAGAVKTSGMKDRVGVSLPDTGERAVFRRLCLAPRKEAFGIIRRIPENSCTFRKYIFKENPWFQTNIDQAATETAEVREKEPVVPWRRRFPLRSLRLVFCMSPVS